MPEDQLVAATYALVIATALLVIAGAIPAITSVIELRRQKAGRAASVVPNMNLLHSRLRGEAFELVAVKTMTLDQLDQCISDMETNTDFVARIIQNSFDVSLKFSNEIYLVRHFITSADDDLRFLAREKEAATGGSSIHDLVQMGHEGHHTRGDLSEEARFGKIAASLLAADASLQAAEALLPKGVRTVDGRSFWSRYSATADKRANEAEKALVDLRSRRSIGR